MWRDGHSKHDGLHSRGPGLDAVPWSHSRRQSPPPGCASRSKRGATPSRPRRGSCGRSSCLTRESFLNSITVLQAIGGSTNAAVHLMAIIGRHPTVAGTITLDTFDQIGRETPLLVDLKPSGENYMTDFHNSGGMLALLHELKPLLRLDTMTITGRTLGEELKPHRPSPCRESSPCTRPFDQPLYPASSSSCCEETWHPGALSSKQAHLRDRRLLQHSGRAVAFAGPADLSSTNRRSRSGRDAG